jgi:hypothetical protein
VCLAKVSVGGFGAMHSGAKPRNGIILTLLLRLERLGMLCVSALVLERLGLSGYVKACLKGAWLYVTFSSGWLMGVCIMSSIKFLNRINWGLSGIKPECCYISRTRALLLGVACRQYCFSLS